MDFTLPWGTMCVSQTPYILYFYFSKFVHLKFLSQRCSFFGFVMFCFCFLFFWDGWVARQTNIFLSHNSSIHLICIWEMPTFPFMCHVDCNLYIISFVYKNQEQLRNQKHLHVNFNLWNHFKNRFSIIWFSMSKVYFTHCIAILCFNNLFICPIIILLFVCSYFRIVKGDTKNMHFNLPSKFVPFFPHA